MAEVVSNVRNLLVMLGSPAARKAYGVGLIAATLYYLRRFMGYLKWRKEIMLTYPGPAVHLVMGNLMDLVEAGGFNEQFFENLHGSYGDFARFFLSPVHLNLSTTNPEQVVELYRKTRSRPLETYLFLQYLGEENLLFQHGALAKQMRLRYGKMISNVEQLDKLNQATYRMFGELFSKWKAQQDDIDLHADVGPYIYKVMLKVLFNADKGEIQDRIYELHKHLIKYTDKFMFVPHPFKALVPGWSEYDAAQKEWRRLCYSLIEDRAAEIRADPKKWENDESALTMIVTSKNPDGTPFFTKGRAISTVCGFLNGAYDTTHSTIYWLFFNLARFPDVQSKVKADIRKVIGSRTEASIEEARQMDYLDAFIRESMRFTATVPVNQRVNYEEDITIGGHTVPKGTNVNIPMSIVFRDKRFFGNDSHVFRPSRFLPEDPISDTAKRAWTAFGGHSRMCVGFTFALVELKGVLISALQQFNVELCDPAATDEKQIEAGVNQPLVHNKFRFTPASMAMEQRANNLDWWTPPREKRKAF
ncbi:Cytochrome P450 4e3 (CYPIVE3), partial [Durusdinium trenchii]